MMINRHNYETFFLLYVDNELLPAEKKAVEEFVQENADLKTEFQSLLATSLPGEDIQYDSKDLLYKDEVYLVQEDLLLLLDNELDAVSVKNIESKISSDNATAREWGLLQQAKLDTTEQDVFKNKRILYRHEARVVPIRFWKIAAAAAILIAILFTGISVLRRSDTSKDPLVKNNIPSSRQEKNKVTGINKDPVRPVQDSNIISNTALDINNDEIKTSLPVKENIQHNNKTADKELVINPKVYIQRSPVQKTPLEKINKDSGNETTASAVSQKRSDVVHINKATDEIANASVKDKITAPATTLTDYNLVPAIPDSYAKTTALNESLENNDHILYVSEERVSRSRIGGLFRKVKRVIERNTNIKTGNGIKIGGYEIALNK